MEKTKNQKKKVQFIVVRENVPSQQTMQEAFEQLIERQTCEHFEEWMEQRENVQKAA